MTARPAAPVVLAMASFVLTFAHFGSAQTAGRLGGGATLEYYQFTEKNQVGLASVTLVTTPLAGRASLGRVATFTVVGAFATAQLRTADGKASVMEGLTDTRATLDLHLIPNGLTLSGIFIAPTGESRQSADEALVAGLVAADLLPFGITNWGTGGGIGFQLSGTRRLSTIGTGFSVSYRQARDFEPITGNSLVYRPGNEIRARLALDANVGGGTKASLLLGFQNFSGDRADGVNLFQSGKRLEVMSTLAFPVGYRGSGAIYGGVLHRESGQFLSATIPDAPSQDLLLVGGLIRQRALGGWFTPRIDVRAFRSADGLGQGYVGGLGLSMEWGAGGTTWIPSVTGRYGSVEVSEGNRSSIVGFQVGLTARLGRVGG
jgi:hypothetical protein